MKKIFWGAVLLAVVLLTGCRSGTEGQSGTVTETFSDTNAESSAKTETSAATTSVETTAEVTEKPAPDVYSENVKAWAETFAGLVYAELENNKTAETPTELYPASSLETSEEALFNAAFNADIFFIDTDFDGVPELFAGGRGITGTGSYTVYTADGVSYGNGLFAHYFDAYCIADGCMFAHSGSTGFDGWTKLCDGLPTIFCNGLLSDEKTNNMTLRYSDGRVQDFNGLTYDEAMDMYRKYLNVEYEKLKFADDPENVPFAYARGVLKVPDPENYTEEDIYNCLVELLAEYEKAAAITSTEETAAAKFEYPEPVLPPEAVKIDMSIDSKQKYTTQLEILDGENILVIYKFKNADNEIIAADAKIFGVSDGGEKLHIEMPKGKTDGYLVKDAKNYRGDDENVYFAIYGYECDGNINWGKSETVVYTDLTYKTQKYTNGVSFYPRFIDIGGKHTIRETEYDNFYDCESNKIILNSIFEGYDSKDGVSYSYEFAIDGDRFVYSMWGYEWSWGFGIYDFTTGTARDVPNVRDHRPMGYHDGKIYSCYCEHDGFTDNILYVTDVNTLETTPFHEFYRGDREFIDPFTDYDNYDYVYDYQMTPDGKFLMNTDGSGEVFKVILYSIDTLEAVREYEFENTYITSWNVGLTEDGKAVLNDDKQKCLYILELDG